ncbi:hypothetical protein MAPG_00885 [Magnaporthiopsis poae ATCC 64411]|uniref:Uncharacterized protein n=1 Tax=Magnaporthiopsis poae (strain ATCC 64411 / 73-15) TaxID=644358 RepID=A0A0C4DM82_MAGP6|nr:hypothetical protein MAPG_00885 [Magnaporthiopsis poae ATCC 64411]
MPNTKTDVKSILDTKPLKFQISAGGKKWACTVHSDRAAYDRVKASRTNSTSSESSTSSHASSTKSA